MTRYFLMAKAAICAALAPGLALAACAQTAPAVPSASTAAAALAAKSPSPALTSMLSQKLAITPLQATGGAGTLFSLAKSRLSAAAFSKVAASVPGMGGLLKAAPSAAASNSALGSLGALAPELPGSAGGLASVYGSFKSLGLSPSMATKMAPLLTQYVRNQGGAKVASLLSGAWK